MKKRWTDKRSVKLVFLVTFYISSILPMVMLLLAQSGSSSPNRGMGNASALIALVELILIIIIISGICSVALTFFYKMKWPIPASLLVICGIFISEWFSLIAILLLIIVPILAFYRRFQKDVVETDYIFDEEQSNSNLNEESMRRWSIHLQRVLQFPFEAFINKKYEGSMLQQGDRIQVTGIETNRCDLVSGVIVACQKDENLVELPLIDLTVTDDTSPNNGVVVYYQKCMAKEKAKKYIF